MGRVNLFGGSEHWHKPKTTSVGGIFFGIATYGQKFPDENYREVIVCIPFFFSLQKLSFSFTANKQLKTNTVNGSS